MSGYLCGRVLMDSAFTTILVVVLMMKHNILTVVQRGIRDMCFTLPAVLVFHVGSNNPF